MICLISIFHLFFYKNKSNRYYTEKGVPPKHLAIDYTCCASIIYFVIGICYFSIHPIEMKGIIYGFIGGLFDLLGIVFIGIALATGKGGIV